MKRPSIRQQIEREVKEKKKEREEKGRELNIKERMNGLDLSASVQRKMLADFQKRKAYANRVSVFGARLQKLIADKYGADGRYGTDHSDFDVLATFNPAQLSLLEKIWPRRGTGTPRRSLTQND